MLGIQLLAVVVIVAWTAANSLVAFVVVKHFSLLRVDRNTELGGLDLSKHNVDAYPEIPTYTVSRCTCLGAVRRHVHAPLAAGERRTETPTTACFSLVHGCDVSAGCGAVAY